ncbi:MAG TPA: hypothetical protein VGD95_04655 [Micavibrio sp.]
MTYSISQELNAVMAQPPGIHQNAFIQNNPEFPVALRKGPAQSPAQKPEVAANNLDDYFRRHKEYMQKHQRMMTDTANTALWNGDAATLKTLKENGVDFTKPNAAGTSPVMMAAWMVGHEQKDAQGREALKEFAAQGVDVQPHVNKALNAHLKVMAEHDYVRDPDKDAFRNNAVQTLINEFKADPHVASPETLMGLARNGQGEALRALEKGGVDIASVKDDAGNRLTDVLKAAEAQQVASGPEAGVRFSSESKPPQPGH